MKRTDPITDVVAARKNVGRLPSSATRCRWLALLALSSVAAVARPIESFEGAGVPSAYTATGGSLSLDSGRYRMDTRSLCFSWSNTGANLSVAGNIPYTGAANGFAAWVYLDTAMPGKQITFQFLKSGSLRRVFSMEAGFTGWRPVLVNFQTHTTLVSSTTSFDQWKVVPPPTVGSGKLWLDGVFFSDASLWDRLAGDRQLPFVNTNQNDHWAPLPDDNLSAPSGFPGALATAEELIGLADLRVFHDYTPTGTVSSSTYNNTMAACQAWGITRDAQGVRGTPVFLNEDNYSDETGGGSMPLNLRSICEDMLKAAQVYRIAENAGQTAYANALKVAFLDIYYHLKDQGFANGCSMGSIHHHGYSTRFWATAVYCMRGVLKAEGELSGAEATMAWFFNRKRVFQDSSILGASADDLNTTIQGRLMSILLIEDDNLAVAYLRAFKSKLDRALTHSYQSIKADGSMWHHGGFYTGYGVPALNNASEVVRSLAGTPFRVSQDAHALLRRAVLLTRVYGNKTQFAPTINGRHPEGDAALSDVCFYHMAKAGTPDGGEAVDREIAAAYMRLNSAGDSGYNEFAALGISPEASPSGSWNVPYGCFQVQRRDNWMVLVKGHDKWNFHTETYATEHRFGRNMAHGSIFVLNQGNPVNNVDSGYDEDAGWDWRHIPGTTAVFNDTIAGMEETGDSVHGYTSHEVIGGHSHQGAHGVFLMRIEGGADNRDDTSLRATKTCFMFDNRIICLGNGVAFTDTSEEVHTILYQKKMTSQGAPIWINGTQVKSFPHAATMGPGPLTLVDQTGVGYYLPDGSDVVVRRETQQSRNNHDTADTVGDHASAWINHGSAPAGESYEYTMVIGADNASIQTFAAAMATPGNEPYTVLSNTPDRIIVRDRATGITACVFPLTAYVAANPEDTLQALDKPGIVTFGAIAGDALDLSVTDPNLNIDPNNADMSIAGTLRVTLKGAWTLRSSGSGYRVLSRNANSTVIEVDTRHGVSVDVPLQSAEASPPVAPFSGSTPDTLALWHFNVDEVYTNGSGKPAVNEARAGGTGDAHANPHGVELSGTASGFTPAGRFGGGHFNTNSGVSDGATVIGGTDLFPTGPDPCLTVECWVKFDDLTGTQMLVDKRFGFNDLDGYRLYWSVDRFHWHLGDGTVRIALSAIRSLQTNTWYHVAATWNAGDDTSRIFLDGMEIASQRFVGKRIVNSSRTVRIAQRNASIWYPLHGVIDEVRISGAARDYARVSPRFDGSSVDIGGIAELASLDFELSQHLNLIATGHTPDYSLIGAPSFASIDAASGRLQMKPQPGDAGSGSFVVRVVDDVGKADEITVEYQVNRSDFVRWADSYDGTEPNTLGLWHFDEAEIYRHSNGRPTVNKAPGGTGEANANPHAAQVYGGAVFAPGGFRGWALHFPGGQNGADRSQVINGASMFPAGPDPSLTVECWVRFNTPNPGYNQFLIDKQWGYSQPSGYRLILGNASPQRFVWYLGDGTSAITHSSDPVSLSAGRWYHVAATWDAATDTSRIYLDGVSIGESVQSNKNIVNSTHELRFGQRNVSIFGTLDGAIDEVRISDTAHVFSPYATPVVDPYTSWLDRHFSPAEVRSGSANPSMDADGDGISNKNEYLLLQDPRDPRNIRAPAFHLIEAGGTRYPGLTYTRSTAATGPVQVLQQSADLFTWFTADPEMVTIGAPLDNGDGTETLTVRHLNPVSGRLFLRVAGSE